LRVITSAADLGEEALGNPESSTKEWTVFNASSVRWREAK